MWHATHPPLFVGRDFAVKKKIYYFCKRERADEDIGISKRAVGSFFANGDNLVGSRASRR